MNQTPICPVTWFSQSTSGRSSWFRSMATGLALTSGVSGLVPASLYAAIVKRYLVPGVNAVNWWDVPLPTSIWFGCEPDWVPQWTI